MPINNSIVARGIDTVIVGYSMAGELDEGIKTTLDSSKELAQDPEFGNGDFPVELAGKEFVILPKGSKGHDWIVQNDDVSLSISRDWHAGEYMPEIMVTFRAAYLWREGIERCTDSIKLFVSKLGKIVDEKVSRCDVCIDIAEKMPSLALTDRCIQGRMRHKSNFIGSAKAYGRKETGYQMGTGTIVSRVYDKLHEIGLSNKDWMKIIWEKGGWIDQHKEELEAFRREYHPSQEQIAGFIKKQNGPESPITRVEFQMRREALKQFGIETIESLLFTLPDIWHYVTQKWFTIHFKVASDTRHTRWPLSNFWKTVQSAVFMFGQRLGVLRSQQIRPRLEHLESMLKGVATSMCALSAITENDFKRGKQAIIEAIQSTFDSPGFDEACRSRQFKFAII